MSFISSHAWVIIPFAIGVMLIALAVGMYVAARNDPDFQSSPKRGRAAKREREALSDLDDADDYE